MHREGEDHRPGDQDFLKPAETAPVFWPIGGILKTMKKLPPVARPQPPKQGGSLLSKTLRLMFVLVMSAVLALVAVGCGKSNDASLQALALSTATFDPPFSPATFDYTTNANTFSFSWATHVTATPTNSQATMRYQVGTGPWAVLQPGVASSDFTLSTGSTDIRVEVTAGDGTTVRVYKITATVSHIELPPLPM